MKASYIAYPVIAFVWITIFTRCSDSNTTQALNKFSDTTLQKIYTLTDQRDAQGLIPFLHHKEENYRIEATLCAASIEDTVRLLPALIELLNDSSAHVRANVAYALGQSGNIKSIEALMTRYTLEKDESTRGNITEAVGKLFARNYPQLISSALYDEILSFMYSVKLADQEERLAWAKGVLAIHRAGIKNDILMRALLVELFHSQAESRVLCAMAMASFQGDWYENEKNIAHLMQWCSTERTPEVRQIQMTLLGKVKNHESEQLLISYALSESQSQGVRVAALRALQKMKSKQYAKLMPLLQDSDDYVVYELLQLLNNQLNSAQGSEVMQQTSKRCAWIAALGLQVAIHAQVADASTQLIERYNQSTQDEKPFFAEALQSIPKEAENILSDLLAEKNPAVKTALCTAFLALCDQAAFPAQIDKQRAWLQIFEQGDLSTQALVAAHWRKVNLTGLQKQDVNRALKQAISQLELPKCFETYHEIAITLHQLGDTTKYITLPAYNHPIDWQQVTSIPKDQRVEIHTSKGRILLQLAVEDSPGSVAAIIRSIDEGYYSNKTFHRVVPNFVIQGGCPRGDGMGSLDYTLRSELGLHQYLAGTVGLASAGKDTESCQFFITLNSTPHLEGKYTILGRVVEGLDVVHQIVPGDRIEKIVRVQ